MTNAANHTIDSSLETTIDYFSTDAPPILTVQPGASLSVHTLDCYGYTERATTPGEQPPTLRPVFRGHCMVGPIAVEGAQPGQTLAVHLIALRPDSWGFTSAGADTPLNDRLSAREPASLLWELDAERGSGTNNLGFSVALAPFLGVIGLAPAEPGEHSTIPPRPIAGGNIDCRELVAGSTLFLPITSPGALLSIGDGHAAQGDGEVSGTAIECGMTTDFSVDIVPDAPLAGIHAITPVGRITFGFDADLNEATAAALDAMVTWMQQLFEVQRSEALALASIVVNLRVTQVVNGTWGVHAVLPHDALQRVDQVV
jgi:acetamidase/formamidase